MASRQRTFELVPTTLVKSNGPRPAMTSKAAKKAYQQANRGPRISRAEQWRRDTAELEAQKKEYERERAAVKAKAAREKKAVKANAEKEARRKMGLPEPSRFVRASQPTISRFVRSDSGKRSWRQMECVEEDSEATISAGEDVDVMEPPRKRVAVDLESEDEFGEFPSFSQSDLLERVDNSVGSMKDGGNNPVIRAEAEIRYASQELPERTSSDDEYPYTDSQVIAQMATTQLLSEASEAALRSDGLQASPSRPVADQAGNVLVGTPNPQHDTEPSLNKSIETTHKSPRTTFRPTCHDRSQNIPPPRRSSRAASSNKKVSIPHVVKTPALPKNSPISLQSVAKSAVNDHKITAYGTPPPISIMQQRSVNMLPPKLPAKAAISIPSIQPSRSQNFRYSTIITSRPAPDLPPSATQAFLEDNFDDFFPSPTQQIRELLDDVDDFPSNTQIAEELSPLKKLEVVKSDHSYLFSTQDYIDELPSNSQIAPETSPSKRVNAKHDDDYGDIISTQELIRSSQNILDIITSYRALPEPDTTAEKTEQLNRGQRRFFEEENVDVPDDQQMKLAPKGKARFFEEKEDDILHAVIHESKLTAAMEREINTQRVDVRFDEGKREKRNLKRVDSVATTDYGSDIDDLVDDIA